MMYVDVTATVVYSCKLYGNDVEMVKQYAEENDCSLEVAVFNLYTDGELDLYLDSCESDFSTESIDSVEEVDYE